MTSNLIVVRLYFLAMTSKMRPLSKPHNKTIEPKILKILKISIQIKIKTKLNNINKIMRKIKSTILITKELKKVKTKENRSLRPNNHNKNSPSSTSLKKNNIIAKTIAITTTTT